MPNNIAHESGLGFTRNLNDVDMYILVRNLYMIMTLLQVLRVLCATDTCFSFVKQLLHTRLFCPNLLV